ncbi:MAG: hypothetical protein LQ347_006067 [Umbilicaria vellea]|nr:MAG: hypothetical protein LQ347_006067 [Umbilicaria vellea]
MLFSLSPRTSTVCTSSTLNLYSQFLLPAIEDATAPSSNGIPSVDASDSSPANAQSSIPSPGPSTPKRTFSLQELSESVGPQLRPPQIVFVRVINTPKGPQTTRSELTPTTFDLIPPNLRRTIFIREEYSSSETSPPEIPEDVKYTHTVSHPPGPENLQADILSLEMNPLAQGLNTGGTIGVAWAVLRAAWCVSDPLYKHLRPGNRLLVMSQGQGLRVAAFAAVFFGLKRLPLSFTGINNYDLPQLTADAANIEVTIPQLIRIKEPFFVGTSFTYVGALAGVLASTYKLHRHSGPRIGTVQQVVGSAAIGWFWAALGQSKSRLRSFQEMSAKIGDENEGQQG